MSLVNSVGNPRDQMTKCTEFVTIFSSASGWIVLEYLDLYLMEFVQIKRRVRGKSSSFWWCKRYSAIWYDSQEHSENYIILTPFYIVKLGFWGVYIIFLISAQNVDCGYTLEPLRVPTIYV